MLNPKCREPLVYQDNTSVIKMVTSGGGETMTKHAYKNSSCFRGGKRKVSGDKIHWYERNESRWVH
jgi:hypothetical protein